ncbi:hypothetical protein [Robertkochia solimangrovi]|uniref:hypothetical protein n=1 Tax=Robertkochia solimangrovi TaxID=2213046 RepID=UPI0013A55EC9|nr:hypothetical protein [Robertkochia solimangrovi]TRZ46215.1 hypothetical protein DMZ48_02870 [Robertkochia solimangrovi]
MIISVSCRSEDDDAEAPLCELYYVYILDDCDCDPVDETDDCYTYLELGRDDYECVEHYVNTGDGDCVFIDGIMCKKFAGREGYVKTATLFRENCVEEGE